MEKILIVGASGLLGSRLMEVYSRDYEVFGTYKNHPAASANSFALDVNDGAAVGKLIGKVSPDLIIDAHAITAMDYCEEHQEEAWKVNVDGAENIAKNVKETGGKLIYISTSDVFDGGQRVPYTETDKPNPINYYGKTKLAGEKAVESVLPEAIIARSASLFGKGPRESSFTNWLMRELKEGKEVSVVRDQDNNFTYLDNLADFLIALYEKDQRGVFHTAGKDIINRLEFANKLADEFGFDKKLILPTTSAALNFKAKRVLWAGLDISKAEKATGVRGMRIDEAIHTFRLALETS